MDTYNLNKDLFEAVNEVLERYEIKKIGKVKAFTITVDVDRIPEIIEIRDCLKLIDEQ